MRVNLKPLEGERKQFRATFVRYGKRINYKGYSEETLLFHDIYDASTNTVVTDHCWFSLSAGFEKLGLKGGEEVVFEARVKRYKKGYVNRKIGVNDRKEDVKFSHPTRMKIVNDRL